MLNFNSVFGRFNTLYAISFWLIKAKKDAASTVNAPGMLVEAGLNSITLSNQS